MTLFTDTTLIVWFQRFSPALDWLFTSITVLGNEAFFLFFIPLVYWCLDRRLGTGLAILFLLSASINALAKVYFGMPRPFMVDPAVKQLAAAAGNGFPSGHTQGAMVVWLYLAVRLAKVWLWCLAGLLIVMIPLSRIYLGVHFPVDLIGGYLIGGLLVWVFLAAERPVLELIAGRSGRWRTVAAAMLMGVGILMVVGQGDYLVSSIGALMGTGLGIWLERRWIGFDASVSLPKRLARFLVGLAGLLIVYAGLKSTFDGLEPAWLWRFIRYGGVGLWIAAGGPWLFSRGLQSP